MASKIDIINRALQHNGAARVIAENDSEASREAASMYEQVRDAELRRHVWTFSIRRTSLAASATTPTWDDTDTKYFPFPTGYIRLVEIKDRPKVYHVEAEGIVASEDAPLYIRYVERVTDEGRFDPLFAEVFAASLAKNMTESVKSSGEDKLEMERLYQSMKNDAVLANSIELPPIDEDVDEWLAARI